MLFPGRTVRQFSCGHLIPRENCLVMPLTKGPSEHPFMLTHANRNDQQMLKELGLALSNLASVPGGMVCFMATYGLLHAALECWMSDGLWTRMAAKRKLFHEQRDSADASAYESYRQATLSGQPALLFAVIGGRLSEGINFADDLCRLLVVVGIPYPNSQDAEMAERIAYHTSHFKSNRFLENLAMRAVNQTVGRAIRHAYDHAAIILIDERYTRLRDRLPGWLQQSFAELDGFGPLYRRLVQVPKFLTVVVFQRDPLKFLEIKDFVFAEISRLLEDLPAHTGPITLLGKRGPTIPTAIKSKDSRSSNMRTPRRSPVEEPDESRILDIDFIGKDLEYLEFARGQSAEDKIDEPMLHPRTPARLIPKQPGDINTLEDPWEGDIHIDLTQPAEGPTTDYFDDYNATTWTPRQVQGRPLALPANGPPLSLIYLFDAWASVNEVFNKKRFFNEGFG